MRAWIEDQTQLFSPCGCVLQLRGLRHQSSSEVILFDFPRGGSTYVNGKVIKPSAPLPTVNQFESQQR
jgi:hypothetical protein